MNGVLYVAAMFGPVALLDAFIVLSLHRRPQQLTVVEEVDNY